MDLRYTVVLDLQSSFLCDAEPAVVSKQEGFALLAAQTWTSFATSREGIPNKEKGIKGKLRASLLTGKGALHLSGANAVTLSSANDSKIRKAAAR